MTEVINKIPKLGQVVRLRARTYLVEAIEEQAGVGSLIQLSCLDDDAQGQQLEVIWEIELDAEIPDGEISIGKKGFDLPRYFSAYIHALRWNCVTATDPRLFQSTFRAGIRIDAYQLEPLRKSLLLPRVNLFIADDVGLGKTIEAGLIASELLLRRRVREVVVACPPSMLQQWKDEMEARFGLVFEIFDRAYIDRVRQERGYGVNPWTTFPRFLISHKLLIDEAYTGPLRDYLDNLRPGTLFILDEAHHVAPSSGNRYAIDSKLTRAIREIVRRFEHRLFLSATPHNGHSNSFSALLELLDDQRFTRGVKVLKSNLEGVMVRRLKEDIRQISGGFPKREVVQVDLSGLPQDAAELKLSKLLDEYRQVRQLRMSGASKRKQAEAILLISHLQQRLLSSIEAFARTLAVHRRTMQRIWTAESATTNRPEHSEKTAHKSRLNLLDGLDQDDERSQLSEEEQEALFESEVENVTALTVGDKFSANATREKELLEQMTSIAENARWLADARIIYLIKWIRENMCEGIELPSESATKSGAKWSNLRLLIFTEYEDTRRYLSRMLEKAISNTDLAEHRIAVYHGPTPPDKREAIKRAFNLEPDKHPLRILIATDAAREGINLQAHCHNLFHFDVPWNPSRLEQRNGRIDRKLQPNDIVYCHYFVYTQRVEDRILQVLVRKTETINKELGSLAKVLENRLSQTIFASGISHSEVEDLENKIAGIDLDSRSREIAEEELEASRERQELLNKQIERLRGHINLARKSLGLEPEQLKDALSCSLELLGAEGLRPVKSTDSKYESYIFPNLAQTHGQDPTWATTLDTLRVPPDDNKRNFQWRKQSPLRPIIFEAPKAMDDDIVQLHLSHRVVQRLLGRFITQGFVHHDLSRACLAQTSDAIPRVILLGRLSLYGPRAIRLHEEILTVTSRWIEPDSRRNPLMPYAREAEAKTLDLLEDALRPSARWEISEVITNRLQKSISRDIEELLPYLEKRGQDAKNDAEIKLVERGRIESDAIRRILEDQKRRVENELGRSEETQLSFEFAEFDDAEKQQLLSNRKYWQRWLENVEIDLKQEPVRVREFYKVSSYRIEPIGLAYLWPITN
jgi:superfamily II DNA or RNA helicase